jgi:hypothetical protein
MKKTDFRSWRHTKHCHISTAVFFNLGSAKPTGSTNYLQGSVRILKLALFLVSKFRQKFNNVSKIPRLEKGWKALLYREKAGELKYFLIRFVPKVWLLSFQKGNNDNVQPLNVYLRSLIFSFILQKRLHNKCI